MISFSLINFIIFGLWFISAIVDYSDYCHLWQLKEYRTDRFRDFLGTEKAKAYFRRYPFLWRSFLAIVIFLWPINNILVVKYLIIAFIWPGCHCMPCISIAHHRLKRPKLTAKAFVIVGASMLLEGGLFRA